MELDKIKMDGFSRLKGNIGYGIGMGMGMGGNIQWDM
jgi:hypothetical protein